MCLPQVPIGGSDEVSPAWVQRAFSSIHHPLCARATGLAASPSDTEASYRRSHWGEEVEGAAASSQARAAGRAGPDDAKPSAGSSGCHDRACAHCPEPLASMYLAIADAESSILMYLVPRPSPSLV